MSTGDSDVNERLAEIEKDLADGNFTLKGFYRKRWRILKPYSSQVVRGKIDLLLSMHDLKNISDDLFFDEMKKLLEAIVIGKCDTEARSGAQQKRRPKQISHDPKPSTSLENRKSLDTHSTSSTSKGEKLVKRIKLEDRHQCQLEQSTSNQNGDRIRSFSEKCQICRQLIASIAVYDGHPFNALEEFVALTDPRLSLFTGDEEDIQEEDARPQNKLTYASVYDKEGHLCPFDSGLIEDDVHIYMSGFIKAIYEEDPNSEGGVPAKDIGPINEWWISGFNSGENPLIGISTAFGDYFIMEPSPAYSPFIKSIHQKIHLSKSIIELLSKEPHVVFEDLIYKLQATVPFQGCSFSEDTLLQHAEFICDQVESYDCGGSTNVLLTQPCMRTLKNLTGITLGKRCAMRKTEIKPFQQRPASTKVSTTPLMQAVLDAYHFEESGPGCTTKGGQPSRRHRCGVCEACHARNCGRCAYCRDMVKFGGKGRSKQACILRRCPNLVIQEAEDSEAEDEDDVNKTDVLKINAGWKAKTPLPDNSVSVEWFGKPIKHVGCSTYYSKVKVNGWELGINDFVLVRPLNPSDQADIAQVMYMWEDRKGDPKFHACWFIRGGDTILGDASDPRELFCMNACESVSLRAVDELVNVLHNPPPENWHMLGGQSCPLIDLPDDKRSFFYQKLYDSLSGLIEDVTGDTQCKSKVGEHDFCSSCERLRFAQDKLLCCVDGCSVEEESEDSLKVKHCSIRWKGENYLVGHGVYVRQGAFPFASASVLTDDTNKKEADENLYPECHRKYYDGVKNDSEEIVKPFCIGFITAIFSNSERELQEPENIFLRMNKMYRPENTHLDPSHVHKLDFNTLYWSFEEIDVPLSEVKGKCFIVCSKNLIVSGKEWTSCGPDRFLFKKVYDAKTRLFKDPPPEIAAIGSQRKVKGKAEKNKKTTSESKEEVVAREWVTVTQKLKSLSVFSGCGGLSEGLNSIAQACWAIEESDAAALSFHHNHPGSTVYSDGAHSLLSRLMEGERTSGKGQALPQKGEVDLICGGPSTNGLKGKSKFNAKRYASLGDSQLILFLSYCDYYRPRFIILENAHNFASFRSGAVLRLTLQSLVKIGYQCKFGVLQDGNFGVPLTSQRFFILAAAPGEILPQFPIPQHAFYVRNSLASITVGDKQFQSNFSLDACSGPLRTVTIRDAISDLPRIIDGQGEAESVYGKGPGSEFQWRMRNREDQIVLWDHICKEMTPLRAARIANIPVAPGSDWRDLPNAEIVLTGGKKTSQLIYTHHDKKYGYSRTGSVRGVCACAEDKACDPMDRQFNTLIPWCLVHTADRNKQWVGLYGRLVWDGFFSSGMNPDPLGKKIFLFFFKGRVIHPAENRIVSVRECARFKGFPDHYRFFGNILEKHAQIVSAVPPQVGRAIALELARCMVASEELV